MANLFLKRSNKRLAEGCIALHSCVPMGRRLVAPVAHEGLPYERPDACEHRQQADDAIASAFLRQQAAEHH
eukprot:5953556-Pyramimonas_sp.AAC.1